MRRIDIIAGAGLVAVALAVAAYVLLRSPAPEPAPTAASQASTASSTQADLPELSFDVVRVEPDGTAVIAGRAPAGAVVTVMDGQTAIGSVTADERGEWVITPEQPLAAGNRQLSLTTTMPDGQTRQSQSVVTLAIPESGKDIAGRNTDKRQAIAIARDPKRGTRLLQGPATGSAEGIGIDIIDYDQQGRVTLGGGALANSPIQIYIDNQLVGHTTSDAQGRWTLAPERELPVGDHSVRADRLDPSNDNKVIARAEITFQRQALDQSQLAGGKAVVILPGNNLWTIAERTYGAGLRYTMIYQRNQDQIRDPDLIYPGQIFILPEAR